MHEPLSQRRREAGGPLGFTLVELMLAMTMLASVMATVLMLVSRQQRVQVGALVVAELRSTVGEALDILPAELRSMSAPAMDVLAMSPTSIRLRSTLGWGVICHLDTTRTQLTLAPLRGARRIPLTSLRAMPRPNDDAFIFDEGPRPGPADDAWPARRVTSDPMADDCPAASGFGADGAGGGSGIRLEVDAALPPTVDIGAPVRFFRVVTYAAYQGADSRWYLGYSCEGCGPQQPVSGPYAPNGVRFTYRDTLGNATTDPRAVHRIDLEVEARSELDLSRTAVASGFYAYRRLAAVAVRNVR